MLLRSLLPEFRLNVWPFDPSLSPGACYKRISDVVNDPNGTPEQKKEAIADYKVCMSNARAFEETTKVTVKIGPVEGSIKFKKKN